MVGTRLAQAVVLVLMLAVAATLGAVPAAPGVVASPASVPAPPFVASWGDYASGPGLFNDPVGLAVAGAGDVYVLDTHNARVQVFRPDGAFLRMWGRLGQQPGQFMYPDGIAVGPDGSVYVTSDARVQKFSEDGDFVTEWGTNGSGAGQFQAPHGVAVDDAGNVFVVDTINHRVQRFTDTGTFVGAWGSEGNGNGQFATATAIAVDGTGQVFVTEPYAQRIQVFTVDGTFVRQWSTGSSPEGVAIGDDGTVYVADEAGDQIQRWAGDGTPLAGWGGPGAGEGQFDNPHGIALTPGGDVLVSERSTMYGTDTGDQDRVQRFAPDGTFLDLWGGAGPLGGQLDGPRGVAMDGEGSVYVADGYWIRKYRADRSFVTRWHPPAPSGQVANPWGVAVGPDGSVYVTDVQHDRVQKFTADGTLITEWGSEGRGPGEFQSPHGVAVDAAGRVFVADSWNHRIQRFTAAGTYVRSWGGPADEVPRDGQFYLPLGVAIDRTGRVYVTDSGIHRVQVFSVNGTFLAKWGTQGTGDGQFRQPFGIAVDRSGRVYVTDARFPGDERASLDQVQVFTSTGSFLTRWGGTGAGAGAFDRPYGIAADRVGRVVTSEWGNGRLQEFAYPPDVTDPTVTVQRPGTGAVYGQNRVVTASYSCTDEATGSGIDVCVGDVPNGTALPTSTVGPHTFSVFAADNAGNTTTVNRTYTVAAPRPDGRIRLGTQSLLGNDLYNTTAAGQTVTARTPRGATVSYFVSAQNDALFADALRLRGSPSSPAFTVRYLVGGSDVTVPVTRGDYRTPALAPGSSQVVRVDVTVRTTAPAGSVLEGTVIVKSDGDVTLKDTVGFTTRRA